MQGQTLSFLFKLQSIHLGVGGRPKDLVNGEASACRLKLQECPMSLSH